MVFRCKYLCFIIYPINFIFLNFKYLLYCLSAIPTVVKITCYMIVGLYIIRLHYYYTSHNNSDINIYVYVITTN